MQAPRCTTWHQTARPAPRRALRSAPASKRGSQSAPMTRRSRLRSSPTPRSPRRPTPACVCTSRTFAEFPVGWTTGHLILAVSEPRCCPAEPGNPYDASSYHVVDPATGSRLFTVCDQSVGPMGPIEPIGAVCYHPGQAPTYQRWDGSPFDAPAAIPNPDQFPNAVAPDGSRVAGGQAGFRMVIFGPRGAWNWLNQTGVVLGWLDSDRIVYRALNGFPLSVLELDTKASAEIAPGGSYLGTFPTALL